MPLKPGLIRLLQRAYAPRSTVQLRYKRLDAIVRTDAEGHATLMFLGKLRPNGSIEGERYVRTFITDAAGRVVKDHWDHKGPAT
jgi:hypothetical protein